MLIKLAVVGLIVSLSVISAGCSTTASTTTAGSTKEASGFGSLSMEAKRDIGEGYCDTLQIGAQSRSLSIARAPTIASS